MADEVVGFLGGRGTVVDMTVGLGGHAEALLDAGVGRLHGVDRDPEALAIARKRLSPFRDRFTSELSPFSEVEIAGPVDGVLYDLGVSSMQLDRSERGFSFREPGPLDMRMGPDATSVRELVNEASEKELADLIYEYGEERRSRRIASAIVRARSRAPIETTDELARVVAGAAGSGGSGGPHPARRTFQALRIAANRELEEFAASLPQAVSALAPGGCVVVIAYHSLEDRIAKHALRGDERVRVLTKKPLRPSEDEVARNPRARSARLRAALREEPEAA